MLFVSYLDDFVVTFIKIFQVTSELLQNNNTKNNSKNSESKKSRYGGFISLYDENVQRKTTFQNKVNICCFHLSIEILILETYRTNR